MLYLSAHQSQVFVCQKEVKNKQEGIYWIEIAGVSTNSWFLASDMRQKYIEKNACVG